MTADNRAAVSRLILEFQSDARVIEDGPVPALARVTLYVVLAFVVVAVGWAALSLVDKVVVARGRLVTTANNLVVQPLETAIVRSIDVKAGDAVKQRQAIGKTGETGLASGDHLHFGVYLYGVAVLPVEWWDRKWIDDNIQPKLGGRGGKAIAAQESRAPRKATRGKRR